MGTRAQLSPSASLSNVREHLMRPLQWTLLLFIVVLGVLWIFLAQNVLFLNLFPGLLVGPGLDLQDYLQTGSSPSFAMLWISCMVALLIWFATTASGRPRSSAEVRRRRPLWWLAAAILVVLGWLYQLFFTSVPLADHGAKPD
jgi:drug/metabolite transporter (DMT)-like permease